MLNLKLFILTFVIINTCYSFKLERSCPPGVPMVNCFLNPCLMAEYKGCAAYPNATCKANYCGGCNAEWFLNGQKVDCTRKTTLQSTTQKCILVQCFVQPCRFASCPSYPNAVCVNNYCGGCNAFFYVNGERVNC